MTNLCCYTDFDAWFDVVADIDPLALEAPHRFTLDKPGLISGGYRIDTVLAWIRRNARGPVHYLEPFPSPLEEYALVFEDVLDAEDFRTVWGPFDGDTPTEDDRLALERGRDIMRRFGPP